MLACMGGVRVLPIQPRNSALIVLAIVRTADRAFVRPVLHTCADDVLYRLPALLVPRVPDRGHGALHVRLLQDRDGLPQLSSSLCRRRLIQNSYRQRARLPLDRTYSGIMFHGAGRAGC